MPLNGALLGQSITAKLAQKGVSGSQTANFANAIGNGIIEYILLANIYNGSTIGIGPSVGTSVGKVSGLVGVIVGQNIFNQMTAKGFSGAQQQNIANGIGEAFAEHISLLGVVNASGGPTAVGTGTGPISGLVGALMGQSINKWFTQASYTGAQTLNIAMAISAGIVMSMSPAIITTTIVGVPPATPCAVGGVEIGKLS